MRNFALLSALERVYPNIRLGYEEFLLFEVGKSHSKLHVTEKLPAEQISLAAVYAATDKAARDGAAFYQAKHFLQLALQSGHCIDLVYDNIDTLKATHWLSPLGHLLQTGRCAVLRAEKQTLGLLGEFKPEIAARLKLPAKLAVWEIDLRALQKLWQPLAEYRPLSRYPSTVQDITLQLPDNVTVAKLSQAIEALLSASRLRYHVKIISIFRPSKHTGQRNVTYRLQLSSYQRTLKTSQVNTLLDKITTTTARSMRTKRV